MQPLKAYDYVIVGGGSAGTVLATRLSEMEDRTVLVLEAGPDFESDDKIPSHLLRANAMMSMLPGSPFNWGFFGQTDYCTVPIPRARVVGGGSGVNGVYFVRPTRDDFDQWEKSGNDQWSYDRLLPYWVRLEDDRDFRADHHGRGGPMPVTRCAEENLMPISRAFRQACHDLGYQDDPDKNAPDTGQGVGVIPANMVDGVRQSAIMTYLNPVRGRPNLTVRSGVFVRRVLFDGTRATGVEVEVGGKVETIEGGEIILSAGAIKSPHLLMLSGIGPANQLKRCGIPVLRDLPGVGQNFQDHPGIDITYVPNRPFASSPNTQHAETALHYTATGSDRASDMEMFCTTMTGAKMMSDGSDHSPLSRVRIPSLGEIVGLIKAVLALGIKGAFRNRAVLASQLLSCRLMSEYSKGTSVLQSADPHVLPQMNFHSFSDPRDLERMRESLRLGLRLMDTPALRPFVKKRLSPTDADLANDETLDRWIKTNPPPCAHTSSSCRMGPASDDQAVVDQYCRVHGVEGLRVVDLSICPTNPRRGPAALAIMIGERAADLIKGDNRAA